MSNYNLRLLPKRQDTFDSQSNETNSSQPLIHISNKNTTNDLHLKLSVNGTTNQTENDIQTEEDESADNNSVQNLFYDSDHENPAQPEENFENQDNMAQPAFNPMTVSFKPNSFNGLNPESAGRWWKAFERYAELSNIHGNERCNLLGLLLTGSSELWFNSLDNATRTNIDRLTQAFHDKYIDAPHTQIQRQMGVLSRVQLPNESVDEYLLASHAKMVDYNYDENLQMTLIINGLRSEIKSAVLQHLPFDNLDQLITKIRHVESAIKAQSPPILPVYSMSVSQANFENNSTDKMRKEIKELESTVTSLIDKIDGMSRKLISWQNDRNNRWRNDRPINLPRQPFNQRNPNFDSRYTYRDKPFKTDIRCYNCGQIGHTKRMCRRPIQQTDFNRSRSPFRTQPDNQQYRRSQSYSPGRSFPVGNQQMQQRNQPLITF